MTLRNEIFEGIAAYKGVNEALGNDPRSLYYNELYKAARRDNDDFTARRVAREKAIAAGRPSVPRTQPPPRMASTALPVVQQAFSPTALPAEQTPGAINNLDKPSRFIDAYQQGGVVKRPFDPEGDGYDYDTAELAGMGPGADGHWPSRDPKTGMQLKGRKHPTWDKAIDTDRRQGYGLEKRDGRYYTQKFADGGSVLRDLQRDHLMDNTRAITQPGAPRGPGSMVMADEGRTLDDIEGYETEADGIVEQLLGRDAGTTGRINSMVGPPVEPSNFSAAGDWAAEGAKERVRAGRAANMSRRLPAAEPPPEVTTEEVALTTGVPERQDGPLRRSAANRAQTRAAVDPPEIDYPSPLPTSSRLGRAVGPTIDRYVQGDPAEAERERLEGEMYDARPGLFEQTTEPERQARARKLEELTAERAALDTGSTPQRAAAPTPTSGLPSVAAVSGPVRATPGDPDNIGQLSMVPRAATTQPNQTPTNGAAVTPQGSRVSGQTNGPPVSNPQPGPTGTASTPAPPAGSTSANTPSGAPKGDGMAPGPGGTRVPKGSLQDQTRTKAFDPVADFNDPGRAPATASLASYTPQELQQTIQGAASVAQQGPVGNGAITRDRFNQYTERHSQGGKFTPGEAMLVGMLSDYKMLLAQGRVDQANKMAYGLIQAASLEAASYGYMARDAFKAGDFATAQGYAVNALNYLPDGKTFKGSPDGKTITAYDAQTGQQTGQMQMTPQMLMALITGVADGSLLWNALQSSAAMVGKPDRNAEGRRLTNDLRREQIEGARLRNQKLRAGGGGRGGGFSGPAAQLDALLSSAQPPTARTGQPRAQGDDTSYIDVEVQDPPNE